MTVSSLDSESTYVAPTRILDGGITEVDADITEIGSRVLGVIRRLSGAPGAPDCKTIARRMGSGGHDTAFRDGSQTARRDKTKS